MTSLPPSRLDRQREQPDQARVLRRPAPSARRCSRRACGRSSRPLGSAAARVGRRSAARRRAAPRLCATRSPTSTRQRRPALRSAASSSAPCRTTPRLSVPPCSVMSSPSASSWSLCARRGRDARSRASARRASRLSATSRSAACSSVTGTDAAPPERRHACTRSVPGGDGESGGATSWASGDASAASARPAASNTATSQSPSSPGELTVSVARAADLHAAGGDARPAGPVGRVTGALVGAGGRGEALLEQRRGPEQQGIRGARGSAAQGGDRERHGEEGAKQAA